MNPRYYPEIDDRVIVRHNGKLRGKITPGEVFAWEPDKPWARMLCIVTFLSKNCDGETMIASVDMDYNRPCINSESRFREACSRTIYQQFPTTRPHVYDCGVPRSSKLERESVEMDVQPVPRSHQNIDSISVISPGTGYSGLPAAFKDTRFDPDSPTYGMTKEEILKRNEKLPSEYPAENEK